MFAAIGKAMCIIPLLWPNHAIALLKTFNNLQICLHTDKEVLNVCNEITLTRSITFDGNFFLLI